MENAIVSTAVNGNAINTIDIDSIEGKKAAINALNNAHSLNDYPNETFNLRDVMMINGIRKGRGNAEDTECINTYFIDDKGEAYFTQSDGIARSMRNILMLLPELGKDTNEGYLPIKIVEEKLQNGNTIKNIVLM